MAASRPEVWAVGQDGQVRDGQIWLILLLMAQDLLAWFAVLILDGDLDAATPRRSATDCCTSPDGSHAAADAS